MWQIETIIMLLLAGSLTGFIAGLLGLGGGLLIVPVVLWAFRCTVSVLRSMRSIWRWVLRLR